jgi:UDP-N-acetyl-D-mannosaminuronic acid dehydrogenase
MHKKYSKKISIIGGAGHIGFPLGLAFANKKYLVNLVDINEYNLNKIKKGDSPFYEIGAKKILSNCLKDKSLLFSKNLSSIKDSKYIIICIGTPIDKNLKPLTKQFFNFFKKIIKFLNKSQIIIIRSSIYPGIINKIYKICKKRNQNISYCPERIVQSKALQELPSLPQILSGFNNKAITVSAKLFKKICNKIILADIKEAELIKLFSNANRYINFAIANQLFLMCEKYGVQFDRVRNYMQLGYERNLNLPKSGFTGGPCLLKDTMQLSSFYKGKFDLGLAAMEVNKEMIKFVLDKVNKIANSKKKTIGVLGVAFKAETDDIRDSLSIELVQKLKEKKFKVIYSDVYYKDERSVNTKYLMKKSDIIIIGAPHKQYKKIIFPKNKYLINIW